LLFLTILALFVGVLLYVGLGLDISYKESVSYYHDKTILNLISHIFTSVFGQNNFALRLPMVLLFMGSNIMFFKLTRYYIKDDKDRFIASVIFMLLPGIVGSSLVVNSSVVVIFLLTTYILSYSYRRKHCYVLLVLFLLLDNSSLILFISLFLYSIKTKDKKLMVVVVSLFTIGLWHYGYDTGGRPRGYFNDTFSVYLSIFSPFLFAFFAYSLYRVGVKKQTDLLWYISATALGVSFLLSFRQKIPLEDFAPYAVVGLPIMVKVFLNSYRVRLPIYRTKFKIFANTVLITLALNTAILLINKPIYLFLGDPKDHFVFNYHFISPLVQKLKRQNISCVKADYYKTQHRLKFYGIGQCYDYELVRKPTKETTNIDIKLYNKTIYSYYLKENRPTTTE